MEESMAATRKNSLRPNEVRPRSESNKVLCVLNTSKTKEHYDP